MTKCDTCVDYKKLYKDINSVTTTCFNWLCPIKKEKAINWIQIEIENKTTALSILEESETDDVQMKSELFDYLIKLGCFCFIMNSLESYINKSTKKEEK